MSYEYKSGTQLLEERYVTFDEVGLVGPDQSVIPSKLWSWGNNESFGELGLGDTTHRSSPVQVGSLTNWASVYAPSTGTRAAIKTDGTLWMWGNNQFGELGLNDTTPRSSPVQVGSLTNWKSVAVTGISGSYHTLAVKTDGTLWSWGANAYGQLGLNNLVSVSSPVQVGSLTNWTRIVTIQNGSYGITADGKLWSWGNVFPSGSSTPIQFGSTTGWKELSASNNHVMAIKTDQTLWAYGNGNYGQLGLGNTSNNFVDFLQVGTSKWRQIICGSYQTVGIDINNGLYAWGKNTYKELGLGNSTGRSSPTQVGTLNDWKQVSTDVGALGGFTAAVKTDGTLWAWGGNYYQTNPYGTLGQNNTTMYSLPTQIGTLTNWKQVRVESASISALQYNY